MGNPCKLCGSNDLILVTRDLRFGKKGDIMKCNYCGLTFLDQDSLSIPKDFYEKEYHQTYLTHIEPDALDPEKYFLKMKKTTEKWADKFKEMLTGKETVLDIGCSTGHFIELIKDKTKKIYGSELNKKEIEFCRKNLKLDVSDEPLKKRFSKGTFDYITMIYVLEHIANAEDFLRDIKQLLKPNGKIVILVPNLSDPLMSFYDMPDFINFYYCIEHSYYFTPETLKRLLEKAGLRGKIEVMQEYPVTNHLSWIYTGKPTDTITSRKGIPNISIVDKSKLSDWKDLWKNFNEKYMKFLEANGFGDRIWCVVGKD
jgi:SAM-dependent methyltransferase